MKVQMIADISGTRNGVDWPQRGGTIDLPDDEAAHLVAAGLAEVPNGKPKARTIAEADPAEPEVAGAAEPEVVAPVARRARK
jgi:hypothetical protein